MTTETTAARPHPKDGLGDRDRRAYEAVVRYAARMARSEWRKSKDNRSALSRAADVLSSSSLTATLVGRYSLADAIEARWYWMDRDLIAHDEEE